MAGITKADFIDFVGQLNLRELHEIVKELKEVYDIEDPVPFIAAGAAGAAPGGDAGDAASETTEKVLMLMNPGTNKVPVIKVMRECLPDLSLTDAKKQLDDFDKPIEMKKGAKEELQKLKAAFEAAGAQVEIK